MEKLKLSPSYQSFTKSPESSFKHTSYFQVYDRLFAPYRNRPITFVEVGVFNGGSLFMWRDFFGAEARIVGIDLNPGAKRWESDGFEIFVGSQADPSFWRDFFAKIGPVDVLLDDGGHFFDQQIVTVNEALPFIKDDGLLVVEDTHSSYMNSYFGPSHFSFVEFAKDIVDRIHTRFSAIKGQPDSFSKSVFAVEFYESIVALRIDRAKCFQPSAVVNRKATSPALDFAETDQRSRTVKITLEFRKLLRRISRALEKIPFVGRPLATVLNDVANVGMVRYFLR